MQFCSKVASTRPGGHDLAQGHRQAYSGNRGRQHGSMAARQHGSNLDTCHVTKPRCWLRGLHVPSGITYSLGPVKLSSALLQEYSTEHFTDYTRYMYRRQKRTCNEVPPIR